MQSYLQVCLVNTGSGTPFISAIDLRPLNITLYPTQMGSLALFRRYDAGTITNVTYRYKDDIYDRFWYPYYDSAWTQVTTSLTIEPKNETAYQPPSIVMSSAAVPKNMTTLDIWWIPPDENTQYHVYMHFAEVEKLPTNQSRLLSITRNGKPFLTKPFSLKYNHNNCIYESDFEWRTAKLFNLSGWKLYPSTVLEIYMVLELLQAETNQEDVEPITNIKLTYGVKRNWQGDPCAPKEYSWEGLNCSNDGYQPPRIISLNLSSSGLTGEIAPSLFNLTMLQTLDLSNNNLTGPLPEFVSQLPNLKILNLEKNKLTGSVPAGLIQKSNDGLLSLSFCENQNLTAPISCGKDKKKKKKKDNFVVPVIVSVVGILILILTVAAVLWRLKRKRKHADVTDSTPSIQQGPLEPSQRQFTYSEVLEITHNFERIVGRGGFGTVYHGYIDDTQVAVKMLSPSSIQGYQEFYSEVNLLMRVHHRNLTSLVGYCKDGTNTGLIYEYMANGNLHKHLSDNSSNILSWAGRLRIAMDSTWSARFEYLHYCCKPPIIHRDEKSTNILLNENFQAKLSDFGLSRIFSAEDGTHEYLDPEHRLDLSYIVEKGDIKSIVDPWLIGNFNSNSVWKTVEIALICVSSSSNRRPTMSQVVMELKECLAIELARKNHHTESEDSIEMRPVKFTTEMRPLAR
ncbi:PREDICTED: probable LRR receptor [Prunus dulcis]|uniref:non-specific serine/threonine protein kinase n=1 Tax=Prunus dulcis TaxID=3755 RepID=A0A5E4FB44_PRUDU|nr:PREDICTED: probable LRR receptor [Prunus dulcis]